jgi:hypothetical protein
LEEIRKMMDNVGKMYKKKGWKERNMNLKIKSMMVKMLKIKSDKIFDVKLDVDIKKK